MSNVKRFGAVGDGQHDDTEALLHALKDGDGVLEFPRGDFVISKTIHIDLAQHGRFAALGSGGTPQIVMAGSGPAFHLVGTHAGTADPATVEAGVWAQERLPTFSNLEIKGRHAQSVGLLLEGTMQTTLEGVLLRELDVGLLMRGRGRNLLVSHSHIYNCGRYGIWLDQLNLHQAIIGHSHISYCKQGGIRITGSEVRNLQINGNDIEYNHADDSSSAADILIDAQDDAASVREGTIVGNTIQAKYSPGGANIRMIGLNAAKNHKAGMFTISGNLIGSQATNVHLHACRGVVVEGNVIYSGHTRNLHLQACRNIVVGANSFDHNPDYDTYELCTGITFEDSQDIVATGILLHDCQTGQHTVPGAVPITRRGLWEISRCQRVNLSGCTVLDGQPHCLVVEDSDNVLVTGCQFMHTGQEHKSDVLVQFSGKGKGNLVTSCRIGPGKKAPWAGTPGVQFAGNLEG